MEQVILFNHIPKTGGTSLRIILNKVYGQPKVFFIKSTDPAYSLNEFKKMGPAERDRYDVISGHGAEYFSAYLNNPFRITILRDPVDLFLSQYHYLKVSPNSVFLEELSRLTSVEAYIDFALKNGQDNLMTRYLSNSLDWLFIPDQNIPELTKEGTKLLEKAKENLFDYGAVLNLATFNSGIYRLNELLGWSRIPLYRPANRTKSTDKNPMTKNLRSKLEELLRFDMELFQFFIDQKLDTAHKVDTQKMSFKLFLFRQEVINKIF
jgi:hypothetical protein